jgi:phosphotransacetylase/acyl dehydratase
MQPSAAVKAIKMNDLSERFIENRVFSELAPGDSASLTHVVTQRDIDLFAAATGDMNPAHVDPAYAATDMFHHVIIHGMWGGGLISAVLGMQLPGPGTIYLSQDLRFHLPVSIGDTITATVTVSELHAEKGNVTLDCLCTNQDGHAVISGTALVRAPRDKLRIRQMVTPPIVVGRHGSLQALIAKARTGPPVAMAVVFPVEPVSLRAALEASAAGLVVPVLVGPEHEIRAAAAGASIDLGTIRVVDVPDAPQAASRAVAMARDGTVAMLMKGDLHTDMFMHPVFDHDTGLRTGRHVSHVYAVDVPGTPRLLLLTDMAINIAPTLSEKIDIVQNAIDCARLIGIATPRVAILAAVETVNAKMPSTVDAAALCKMAERGQITGGLVDGPLAFDNAVSIKAAAEKGIVSEVAGRADILVVPDLEAGNMLAKELIYLAGAEAAGVVLGAAVPIVLTSRADDAATRLASCALGVLMARAKTA